MAIIRDMQFDPVSERLLHVDLQEVSADRAITVRVAVHPVGEAIGVKDTKGILNLVLHEVEVSCLPTNIPERIDADVSSLAIGDVLTVGDLTAARGRAHPERSRAGRGDRVAADGRGSRGTGRDGGGHAGRARGAHRAQAEGRRGAGRGRDGKKAPAKKPEKYRHAWPTSWWDSGIRARSTGTPATTWASASLDVARRAAQEGVPTPERRCPRRSRQLARRHPLSRQAAELHERQRPGGASRAARRSVPTPDDLVLVYDDIDLQLGKVRTRLKGSAGGHNGVRSVIEALGTEDIRRVKIGIGRPAHKAQVPDHVLTVFEPEEEDTVAAAVTTAAARVLELIAKG